MTSRRLLSLDALRGLAIAGMILVNNPGSWSYVYPPLDHAPWHGWTPTDLVFPFFLFAVGVALTFSFARRREAGAADAALVRKIAGRAAAIIVIGLILNFLSIPDFSRVRYSGVLQRIGVVYLCAALAYLYTRKRGRAYLTAGLLVGYWAAMMLVPVPGHGAGVLDKDGNLAQYIDLLVLRGHTWEPAWDPEGIMSTFPAIATCLLGTLTGDWLRSDRSDDEKLGGMFVAGAAGLVIGLILHPLFPINKNLWSSTYVLFTGGFALQTLAVCYWLIEIRGVKRWAWPLLVFGSNAILVFVLSGLLARVLGWIHVGPATLKAYLYDHWFASWAGPLNGSLAFALAYVLLWLGAMTLPYRKGWFLRL